jgi:hypothetical protein
MRSWEEVVRDQHEVSVQTGHAYVLDRDHQPFAVGDRVRFWEERYRIPGTDQRVEAIVKRVEWNESLEMWACLLEDDSEFREYGADMLEKV